MVLTTQRGKPDVTIVGGGLAGAEAAWQIASRGYAVRLFEMRPVFKSPAHQTGDLAELVCSNSLRSAALKNAVGLLKAEMRALGSLIIQTADESAIPGGGALVVDRMGFSKSITNKIENHPNIEVIREEVKSIPDVPYLLIASGPLTSTDLSRELAKLTGDSSLYFYDSIAPIVEAESIDEEIAFRASRWGKGEADYLNCPLTKEEYCRFVEELCKAEKIPTKEFDQPKFFEGCLPIEVIAERGQKALAFGPMKPVGLTDPRTGRWPHAVVQLRQDDLHGTLYNMVGFQTRMKYPEQKRVFRMIPGLEKAEFVRFGSMHRNTFVNSPRLLDEQLQLKSYPGIFLAGQMIGVEGYVESAATGLYVGLAISKRLKSEKLAAPSPWTALGSLVRHVTRASSEDFQPMNVNFGLFDLPDALRKKNRRLDLAKMALNEIEKYKDE